MAAANSAKKQRGKPFKPGQSGNPGGRPQGSRNKATLAIAALFEGEAEGLTRKAIELAKEGDLAALRLCLERICPPSRERPITIDLPKIETIADIAAGTGVIIQAVARGEITPGEGTALANMLEGRRKALETDEIVRRIEEIEERHARESKTAR